MSLATSLHEHVFADNAQAVLMEYLDGGWYSGAWFDTLGGAGDAPGVANQFTAADVVAVSTLSVDLGGWSAVDVLHRRSADLAAGLAQIPLDRDLHDADDDVLDAVFALQGQLDDIHGIGPVTRSKLLARKRPRLVPIRDQHVLRALIGHHRGSFTRALRDALRAEETVRQRLAELASQAGIPCGCSTSSCGCAPTGPGSNRTHFESDPSQVRGLRVVTRGQLEQREGRVHRYKGHAAQGVRPRHASVSLRSTVHEVSGGHVVSSVIVATPGPMLVV